jgi:hypothetical protein
VIIYIGLALLFMGNAFSFCLGIGVVIWKSSDDILARGGIPSVPKSQIMREIVQLFVLSLTCFAGGTFLVLWSIP